MGVVLKSLEMAYNIRTHIVGENELILDHLAREKYILLAQCTYSAKELHSNGQIRLMCLYLWCHPV